MATAEAKPQTVSFNDLLRAKTSLESDLEVLTSSQEQLIGAQGKFLENIAGLCELKGAEEGQELMLPVTSTVYVQGKTCQIGRVTVDIGTGYYAEMAVDDAIEYYKRKIEFIQKQVSNIVRMAEEKKGQYIYVMQTLQKAQSS